MGVCVYAVAARYMYQRELSARSLTVSLSSWLPRGRYRRAQARRERTDYPIVIHRTFVLAASVLFASATSALAAPSENPTAATCRCATTPEALLDQVDHIFIGDIVEVKGGGEGIATAVIRVRENLKGVLTGVVEVRDAVATDCAWSVFEMAGPGRFVVFANLDEGDLVTPASCPQTQPFSGWKDRLAPFRAFAKTQRPVAAPGAKPTS
jgi:hypothetical protein